MKKKLILSGLVGLALTFVLNTASATPQDLFHGHFDTVFTPRYNWCLSVGQWKCDGPLIKRDRVNDSKNLIDIGWPDQ